MGRDWLNFVEVGSPWLGPSCALPRLPISTARKPRKARFKRCSRGSANPPTSSLIAGDLTDYGLPEEARGARARADGVRIPAAAVLGNHDLESGKSRRGASDSDRRGPRRAGRRRVRAARRSASPASRASAAASAATRLGPWGETIIKQFVREAVDEALKLEAALARLRTDAAHRAAALLADSADGGRRAARDLSVPRIEPPRGADRPLSGVARRARSRAPRPARGRDEERRARSTTSRCRCSRATFADRPPFRVFERAGGRRRRPPSHRRRRRRADRGGRARRRDAVAS